MAANIEKSRYWAFIYYEESPIKEKDIESVFIEHGVRAVESPWHDRDINEDTGELKKKHKHIILCFDGPATQNQAKKITDKFNSPIPIAQVSIKGAVRYLTHSNNPEKAQYDGKDIKVYGFENLQEIIDLTDKDIREIMKNITNTIELYNITEYWDLYIYYQVRGLILEEQYIREHTLLLSKMIDSYRNKLKNKYTNQTFKEITQETEKRILKGRTDI